VDFHVSGAGVAGVASAAMRYLVESYLPVADAERQAEVEARARAAADELAREGAPVRHLNCVFVPEDEMCLLLYDAASPEIVREASRRAGLECERVLEAAGRLEAGSPVSEEGSP
jgi:hypothetical protein